MHQTKPWRGCKAKPKLERNIGTCNIDSTFLFRICNRLQINKHKQLGRIMGKTESIRQEKKKEVLSVQEALPL